SPSPVTDRRLRVLEREQVGSAPAVSGTRSQSPGAFADRKYGPLRRSVGANESRPPTTSGAAENRIEPPPPATGNRAGEPVVSLDPRARVVGRGGGGGPRPVGRRGWGWGRR